MAPWLPQVRSFKILPSKIATSYGLASLLTAEFEHVLTGVKAIKESSPNRGR